MKTEEEKIALAVNEIVDVLDSSTLLGAAWDCISEGGKEKLRAKFLKAIRDSIYD